jgi:hypothetical protein
MKMKLTLAEEKLLKKISEAQLITKSELREFMGKEGKLGGKDASGLLDIAAKQLMDKDLVSIINPIGSTCYIITKQGATVLKDM